MKLVEEEEARLKDHEEKLKLDKLQSEDEHAQTVQGRKGRSNSRSRSRSASPSSDTIENETF